MSERTITAWAIKAPEWSILKNKLMCVEDTRAESINSFYEWHQGNYGSWKQAYRKGFRCVKVQIAEMEEGK